MQLKESPASRSRSFSADLIDDENGTLVTDEEELDDHPKESKKEKKPHATRRRVVQSCSECRRRFPCGPCILRQDQARCHEVGIAEKQLVASSNYATTQDLATLAHRLDALEAALVKAGTIVPSDLEQVLTQIQANVATTPVQEQSHHVANPSMASNPAMGNTANEDSGDNVSDTEGAALTLEHLAFGRARVDGAHSIASFSTRKPSSVSRPAAGQGYHLVHGSSGTEHDSFTSPLSLARRSFSFSDGKSINPSEHQARIIALAEALSPMDVFEMYTRKTDVVLNALTRVLPSHERGELLVNAFLNKVDWLHRLFHTPTLLSQCRDLWALPRERVVHEISMPFMAVYFVVITLGLHFMDAAEAEKHFTADEVQSLCDVWYSAARSAQWASDFIGTHTLENLQALILMSVLMNNRDRADAAWALLGASIKMAQGLGLSRLGSEQQGTEGEERSMPMWKGRWESLIQREVGRRIWWNLVFLDWSLAPSYNYASSIQPDQIKSALPANIEDEDLIDGQPLRAQRLNVRTRMSFQLAKLKFAEISQRQIWQANNNNHPPYSFILSVDRELRKAMLELPAFFQPDNSPNPTITDPKKLVEHYEKITLSLAIHSRMLRLHRPWLSRGYEDERFAYSKEQCIRAARASLRMMSDTSGVARFLEKWWIPLFYVTVSGMVIIIDLLKTAKRDMKSRQTEEKIAEVKGALDQMRHISESSIPAKAAIKVMDFLMAEVEDRRRPGGSILGKRKGESEAGDDEEHNLQRAVKRLIRQAQLESDSPSNSSASFVSPSGEAHTVSPRDSKSIPTPEQRPVFGAYPMPGSNNGQSQVDVTQANNATNSAAFAPPFQFATQNDAGGFNFTLDPSANALQQFDAPQFVANQPNLDPAVESMLASYFPNPNTSTNNSAPHSELGPAAAPQVPDDFLSRVFSFSWDGNQQQQPANASQSATSSAAPSALPTPQNNQQIRNNIGAGNGVNPQPPQRQDSMSAYGAFDWSGHGWMA
ncbi:hypothetical protein Q8F55_006417 [Vanrija albida]|uniref:Xylanolytic transcriptional activator regulatory domain-containing protein n=1 Tax=Vanrija albida TaxID=181172 RepID=A0ABR3PX40_9TREE